MELSLKNILSDSVLKPGNYIIVKETFIAVLSLCVKNQHDNLDVGGNEKSTIYKDGKICTRRRVGTMETKEISCVLHWTNVSLLKFGLRRVQKR